MNTNLKKNLQDLIDEYKANKIIFWAEFKQTLGGFNKEEVRNRYTPVGLSEVVQEANGKMVADLNATCELNTAIPIIADGVRNRNDGYTPSGIRKLEELNREMDQLIQNRLAERKRIAANG